MRKRTHVTRLAVMLTAWALLSGGASAQTFSLELAKPESVGFSSERLKRLEAALKRMVDAKEYAGMVTAMARHGKVVHFSALGMQDQEKGVPMQKDTIFYLGSMTKPVTAVAMMILYEEGKWRPQDPIATHIPEFANLKVFAGMDKNGKMMLEEPKHKPTMEELLSMSAGFSYPIFAGVNPIDTLYRDERVLQSKSLKEMIDKIAKIPLMYQPGSRWVYGASADIQGYLIEKLSGKTIQEFMRERLFEPLKMKDSTFAVPKEKLPRLAQVYTYNPEKRTAVATPMPEPLGIPPNLVSGGGGLYTTAGDFLRLMEMLSNGGHLDGVDVLAPSSVRIMSTNHLSEELLAPGKNALPLLPNGMVLPDNTKNLDAFGIGFNQYQPGYGYGYNVAVKYDPLKLASAAGAGTFSWGGAFGTWFWVDPTNDVTFIGMIQRSDLQNLPDFLDITETLAMQALVDPEK